MNKETLKNWRGTVAVMGVDWGDSGKGRLIDDLASRAHIVARYAGGSNTGHTVKNQYGRFALHIIPSGIFNPKAICLVGRNVAVDAEILVEEMSQLDGSGISYHNLIIDEQASLTMPWHKLRDGLREKRRDQIIGTTGHGVGPTYADRTERVGLLVKDLISKDFKQKIEKEAQFQNEYYKLNLNVRAIYVKYTKLTAKIRKFIGKTIPIIREAKNKGKNILFEGAQGYFLDIDVGTYPFVTSSNPGIVGIWRCFDLHPSEIDQVIGITKAYMTRVGEGPMPTKIGGEVAKHIVEKGKEIGTTTGRTRTPGWLDLVLIKAAVDINKITSLAVTKLDVLTGISPIRICVGYKIDGKDVDYRAHDAQYLSQVEPEYEELSGWQEDITSVRKFDDLPTSAQRFIRKIEKYSQIPVKFISVGPKRGEVIYI